jgi:hypothetical protein
MPLTSADEPQDAVPMRHDRGPGVSDRFRRCRGSSVVRASDSRPWRCRSRRSSRCTCQCGSIARSPQSCCLMSTSPIWMLSISQREPRMTSAAVNSPPLSGARPWRVRFAPGSENPAASKQHLLPRRHKGSYATPSITALPLRDDEGKRWAGLSDPRDAEVRPLAEAAYRP